MFDITLSFQKSGSSVVLANTVCRTETGEFLSTRGKDSPIIGAGSFVWSPGVKALAILLVQYAIFGADERSVLSGEAGSPAASLDYALSKQPRWLCEMFGARGNGTPNIRYLVQRINSGRKQPGPVRIAVRSTSRCKVSVRANGRALVALTELIDLLACLAGTQSEMSRDLVLEQEGLKSNACPYPGLRSFEETEARYFYGREEERAELVRQITSHPCVTLVGSSGSGKSSLIKAGVVPELKSHSEFSEPWRVAVFRPLQNGLIEMTRALLPLLASNKSPLRNSHEIRRHLVNESINNHCPILLVVDQAEELFTVSEDPEEFLDCLHELIDHIPQFQVLFSIRSDFLGHLIDSKNGNTWASQVFPLPAMRHDQLRVAIEVPARVGAVQLERGLVDDILDDVGASVGHLPLLQFILRRLWDLSSSGAISRRMYYELGRLRGALSKHCEDVVSRWGPSSLLQFDFLISGLVNIDPGSGAVTKRRLVLDQGAERFSEIIRGLIDARILTADTEDDRRVVEFSHEAILTGWERLSAAIVSNLI